MTGLHEKIDLVQHVVIDGEGLSFDDLYGADDDRRMFDFLRTATRLLQMQILRGPEITRDGAKNPGITGFVLWSTSHAACHVFDHGKQVRADFYSCKPYPLQVLKGLFDTYYPCQTTKVQIIERDPVEFPI